MKVRLLKTISPHQPVGSIIEVAEAYARNYLIPQKIAVVATAQVLNEASMEQQKKEKRQQKIAQNINTLAERLAGTKLIINRPANAQGTLFAALKLEDIITALDQQLHLAVEPIEMAPAHIKVTGIGQVVIKFKPNTKITVTVEVIGQSA